MTIRVEDASVESSTECVQKRLLTSGENLEGTNYSNERPSPSLGGVVHRKRGIRLAISALEWCCMIGCITSALACSRTEIVSATLRRRHKSLDFRAIFCLGSVWMSCSGASKGGSGHEGRAVNSGRIRIPKQL